METSWIEIGHTKKTHGVQGWLRLHIEPEYLEDLLQSEAVFLGIQGQKVPYFIDCFDTKNELLVKFEDIDSRESAVELSGKPLFLRPQDLLPEEERTFVVEEEELQYAFLEGFTLLTEEYGTIGEIIEVLEFPQQEMAILEKDGKELLIPLNEDFILSIDEAQQQVWMDLPEGLINL